MGWTVLVGADTVRMGNLDDGRRTGLGRMLMEATMDHFRSGGCNVAYLWVMQENAAARRFYEASGWQLDDTATRSEPLPQVRYRIRV